jgi:hypothetical protein
VFGTRDKAGAAATRLNGRPAEAGLCGQGEPSAAATARISIKTDRDFIQSGIRISFKFESNAFPAEIGGRNFNFLQLDEVGRQRERP